MSAADQAAGVGDKKDRSALLCCLSTCPPPLSDVVQLPPMGDIVEEVGFGWGQYIQIVTAGAVYMADGSELLLLSACTMSVQIEWGLDSSQRAWVVSIVFIGTLIGNFISGPIGDTMGRRLPILTSFLGVFVFSLLSVFAWGFSSLVAVRFFVGIAFGIGIPSWNALAGEIVPADRRLHSCVLSQILFAGGEMYAAILIWLDDPQMENLNWRNLVIYGAIPSPIFLVVGYFIIYESPSYLALRGKYREACEVLKGLATSNSKPDLKVEFRPPRQQSEPADAGSAMGTVLENFAMICGRSLGFTTFVLSFSAFTANFFYYGGGMYAFSQVLPEVHMHESPALNLLIGAMFEIPGLIAAVLIGQFVMRKTACMIALSGVLTSMVVIVAAFSCMHDQSKRDLIPLRVEVALQIGMFSFKMFSTMLFGLIYVFSAEVYPTRLRTTGTGVVITIGRIGAICSPLIYEQIMSRMRSFVAFVQFMMVICVVDIIIMSLMPYETSGTALKDHVDELEVDETQPLTSDASQRKASYT